MIQNTRNVNSRIVGRPGGLQNNHRQPSSSRQGQRTRRIRRAAFATTALIGLSAILVMLNRTGSVNQSGADDVAETHAVPVRTFQPSPANSYQISRNYTGLIVARRKTDLGFELPGKVITVLVDAGDEVDAGEPLAELNVERLNLRREELLARQAQAQSVLDELINGPRQEIIEAARSDIVKLQAQVDLQEKVHVRRKSLFAKNAVPQEEYEEAALALQATMAELAGAQQRLRELTNGTRPEKINAQQAIVNQIAAQVANVDLDLKKSVLRAPFAGRIARRIIDEGNVVETGQSILQLVEARALEAWIGVPPEFAAKLTVGDPRTVIVEGAVYPTHVSRLLPTVDRSTHTQTVILEFASDDASETIVDGQVVRVQLESQVEEQGMWLPTTSLEKSSRGLWTCYVLEECRNGEAAKTCRIARRFVELLHSDGVRAFVRGTIEPGEHVVSDATHRNVPGQLVRIGKEM